MKKIIIPILTLSTCWATLASAQYSSSQTDNGYSSNQSGYTTTTSDNGYTNTNAEHPKRNNHVSFSVNLPGQETIVVSQHGIKTGAPRIEWVPMTAGQPLPRHAVIGGGEAQGPLYVCRANYNGGVHPGKLYQGQCDISWGGNQIPLSRYEVLVSKRNMQWIPAHNGYTPRGALQGGSENGRPLYICQAKYQGGTHIGKVVGQNCNFAWGDGEITVPRYNVLVD